MRTGPAPRRRPSPVLLAGAAAAALVALTGCGADPLTPDDLLVAQGDLTPTGVVLAQGAGRSTVELTVEPGAALDAQGVPTAAPLTVAITCEGDADAHVTIDGIATGAVSCGFRRGDAGYVAITQGTAADLGAGHTVGVETTTGAAVAVTVLVGAG